MGLLKPREEITKAIKNREMRQLFRPQTLIDVVYGITLFRIFWRRCMDSLLVAAETGPHVCEAGNAKNEG